MALVFWALLLAVLVPPSVVAVEAMSALEMEPRLWQHELKKTYCQMIKGQRIFKLEQLEVYCAGKVSFFDDDMVSDGTLNGCGFSNAQTVTILLNVFV